ncbi:MAG: hypothetical protein DMF89_01420 [Acidobacteria bacterium]|nr:MAG: hypothetical protein DMF89_01420 [Acidobacteriota bacterium]
MTDNGDRIAPMVRRAPRSVGLARRIWALRENGVEWSAELRDRGPMGGVEAQIFKSGARVLSQRCDTRLAAIKWAGMNPHCARMRNTDNNCIHDRKAGLKVT